LRRPKLSTRKFSAWKKKKKKKKKNCRFQFVGVGVVWRDFIDEMLF
jgi:hypothetical protein